MRLAIYSCEGFAREILPVVKNYVSSLSIKTPLDLVFVDDNPKWHNQMVNGIYCISFETLCSNNHKDRKIVVAIGDPQIRKQVVEKCENVGFEFINIFSTSFINQDETLIENGGIFCDFTMVLSNAKIGKHFHCNIYSYVAHDCIIGDFVTFAPRVNCNGRVHIGDLVYIGTNVTFRQGIQDQPLRIGEGAVVGMGAVVTKDVEPYTIVVGNPAKFLKAITPKENLINLTRDHQKA